MTLYATLATKEDLATFLVTEVVSLPTTAERLLKRASELIQQAMLSNYDMYNVNHAEAAMLATCAQVEYWIESGEGISGQVQSYSVGDVSINFGANSQNKGLLASRAKAYLNQQGLLYRGARCDRRQDDK